MIHDNDDRGLPDLRDDARHWYWTKKVLNRQETRQKLLSLI